MLHIKAKSLLEIGERGHEQGCDVYNHCPQLAAGAHVSPWHPD